MEGTDLHTQVRQGIKTTEIITTGIKPLIVPFPVAEAVLVGGEAEGGG